MLGARLLNSTARAGMCRRDESALRRRMGGGASRSCACGAPCSRSRCRRCGVSRASRSPRAREVALHGADAVTIRPSSSARGEPSSSRRRPRRARRAVPVEDEPAWGRAARDLARGSIPSQFTEVEEAEPRTGWAASAARVRAARARRCRSRRAALCRPIDVLPWQPPRAPRRRAPPASAATACSAARRHVPARVPIEEVHLRLQLLCAPTTALASPRPSRRTERGGGGSLRADVPSQPPARGDFRLALYAPPLLNSPAACGALTGLGGPRGLLRATTLPLDAGTRARVARALQELGRRSPAPQRSPRLPST